MEIKEFFTIEGDRISDHSELKDALKSEAAEDYECFIEDGEVKMVGIFTFYGADEDKNAEKAVEYKWYGFPKYYDNFPDGKASKEEIEELKTISKTIEKLRADKKGKILFEGDRIFSGTDLERNAKYVNKQELAKFLVKDYMENGIYRKSKPVYFRHGSGRIAWGKTVRKSFPIINGDSVVYNDLWKRREQMDENSLISSVHFAVLHQAVEVFRRANQCNLVLPKISGFNEKEDLSRYRGMLNNELLVVFSDRESNLLKALVAWIGSTYNYRFSGCTNCFQKVWEYVNDDVFGNQIGKKNKFSGNPAYSFYVEDGEKKYKGTGEAQPDTIFFENSADEDKTYLIVYDSKYYVAKFNQDEIFAYPSNSDIVKQVAYLRGIYNASNIKKIRDRLVYKNVFLLPMLSNQKLEQIGIRENLVQNCQNSESLYTEVGYVEQASFDEMVCNIMQEEENALAENDCTSDAGTCREQIDEIKRKKDLEKVYLYMVYCDKLFHMYLKGKKHNPKKDWLDVNQN